MYYSEEKTEKYTIELLSVSIGNTKRKIFEIIFCLQKQKKSYQKINKYVKLHITGSTAAYKVSKEFEKVTQWAKTIGGASIK